MFNARGTGVPSKTIIHGWKQRMATLPSRLPAQVGQCGVGVREGVDLNPDVNENRYSNTVYILKCMLSVHCT